jgi:hypothetical protein
MLSNGLAAVKRGGRSGADRPFYKKKEKKMTNSNPERARDVIET